MSKLARLIHQQSQSLDETDARRVLEFINALKVSATVPVPKNTASAPGIRGDVLPLGAGESTDTSAGAPVAGTAAAALALLATPRFSNAPVGSAEEVQQRIEALRQDWDSE